MSNLKASLKQRLEGAERVAVLAVGSKLRGDDAAGLLIAEELDKALQGSPKRLPLEVFLGHTAPENLTGEIKRYQPTHLIVLDAADMGQAPGRIALIEPGDITDSASFSTHSLPLSVLVNYVRRFVECQVIIIGIQPATREFGREPTEGVKKAAREVAEAIVEAVS